MIPTRYYRVTVKIKLHTSPLRELEYLKEGMFVKETKSCFIFGDFRVRKENVVTIVEL